MWKDAGVNRSLRLWQLLYITDILIRQFQQSKSKDTDIVLFIVD